MSKLEDVGSTNKLKVKYTYFGYDGKTIKLKNKVSGKRRVEIVRDYLDKILNSYVFEAVVDLTDINNFLLIDDVEKVKVTIKDKKEKYVYTFKRDDETRKWYLSLAKGVGNNEKQ